MTFKLSHSVQLVTLILYHVTLGNSTTSTSRSPTKTFTTTSTTLADAKTTSVLGGSNCAANCTLTYYEFGKMSWAPIKLSTTYTHTVILVVDEEHHTTRTSTELVAIPPSVNTHNLLPTNSAGTVIASLGGGTFLTYPTNTIFYPTDVNAGGTYSTSDRCVTLPAKITWPSSALSSLTQDEATFPTGETDRFGILYTLKNIGTFYPSAFLEAQTRAGIIPKYEDQRPDLEDHCEPHQADYNLKRVSTDTVQFCEVNDKRAATNESGANVTTVHKIDGFKITAQNIRHYNSAIGLTATRYKRANRNINYDHPSFNNWKYCHSSGHSISNVYISQHAGKSRQFDNCRQYAIKLGFFHCLIKYRIGRGRLHHEWTRWFTDIEFVVWNSFRSGAEYTVQHRKSIIKLIFDYSVELDILFTVDAIANISIKSFACTSYDQFCGKHQ
ncbi:hypothetical protein FKW77_010828 [Venturia effusa]|uniref:Uncharacterized protein n=1 Tax=Venturia effusa TaxID=50376 RepID=A0A517KYL4_9PEZI|nr:hypothetical protein FKW77_010828 [Venturia effusa]